MIDIHESDHLYRFIVERRGKAEGTKAYFQDGLANALQISEAAKRFCKKPKPKILEFASGYGRVTRHLRKIFSDADITSSDIHSEACEFINQTMSINAIRSSTNPRELSVGSGYDFIFVISLFSHIPNRTFEDWVKGLYSILAPNGILLFTTHGDQTKLQYRGIDLSCHENGEGWVYLRQSDQPDLEFEDYGTMLVTPNYVMSVISRCEGAFLRSFASAAWFTHQDEWIIQKP